MQMLPQWAVNESNPETELNYSCYMLLSLSCFSKLSSIQILPDPVKIGKFWLEKWKIPLEIPLSLLPVPIRDFSFWILLVTLGASGLGFASTSV